MCLLLGWLFFGFAHPVRSAGTNRANADRIAANGAGRHRIEIMPAGEMTVDGGRAFRTGEMSITPLDHRKHNRLKFVSSLGEPVFVAWWTVLISNALKYTCLDHVGQSFGKNSACDAEPCLKIVEAADPE